MLGPVGLPNESPNLEVMWELNMAPYLQQSRGHLTTHVVGIYYVTHRQEGSASQHFRGDAGGRAYFSQYSI